MSWTRVKAIRADALRQRGWLMSGAWVFTGAWWWCAVAALTGCAGSQVRGPSWHVYVRDEPVAVVTVDGEPDAVGSVVDVEVYAQAADVTLWRRGPATLEPLRHQVGGLALRFDEKDVAKVAPLGKALATGRYAAVEMALNSAGATQRDDLVLGLLATTSDEALSVVRQSPEGRQLVVRLFDELTSGKVGADEERQAARVLRLLAQRWGPEGLLQAVAGNKVKYLPFRKFGVTVVDSASPSVTRGARGGLDVKYPSRVARYPEAAWLATGSAHLEEDEWVAIRLYDEGGIVRFVPALFLFQLANAEEASVLLKALEVFSLGVMGGVGVGGTTATALVWVDLAAVSLGVILTTVSEHRGWILQRYGEKGGQFVFVVETLNSLVAFYGLARVAMAVPQVFAALKRSYQSFRAAQEALALPSKERAIAQALQRETETLLVRVEEAEKLADVISITRARKPPTPPSAPAQPLQRFEEEVLRATGTEGRLVRIRPEGEDNLRLVASAKPKGSGHSGVTGKPWPASDTSRTTTGLLDGVTVISNGKVVARGTIDVRATVEGIQSGRLRPRSIFANREGRLPRKGRDYYQEFVHPTPGVDGAGPQRIVRGQDGELYYTPDHYLTFIPLN